MIANKRIITTANLNQNHAKYSKTIPRVFLFNKKRNKKKELEEFLTYLSAVMPIDRSVIAVVSEAKDVLFGKGKSNYAKAVELINMQRIAYKAAGGMLEMINKMLNPKYERQCTPKVLKNEIKEIEV